MKHTGLVEKATCFIKNLFATKNPISPPESSHEPRYRTYVLAKKVFAAHKYNKEAKLSFCVASFDSKKELIDAVDQMYDEKLNGMEKHIVDTVETTQSELNKMVDATYQNWQILEGYELYINDIKNKSYICIFLSPLLATLKAINIKEMSNGKENFEIKEITSPEFFLKHIISDSDTEVMRKSKFGSVSFASGVGANLEGKFVFDAKGDLAVSHFDISEEDKQPYISSAVLPASLVKMMTEFYGSYASSIEEYAEWSAEKLTDEAAKALKHFQENTVIVPKEGIVDMSDGRIAKL